MSNSEGESEEFLILEDKPVDYISFTKIDGVDFEPLDVFPQNIQLAISNKKGYIFIGGEEKVYFAKISDIQDDVANLSSIPIDEQLSDLAISKDENYLSLCVDSYLELYSIDELIRDPECKSVASVNIGDEETLLHVAWSNYHATNCIILSESGNAYLGVYDTETKEMEITNSKLPYEVSSVCYSPSHPYFAVGGPDGKVVILNQDFETITNISLELEYPVHYINWFRDENLLISQLKEENPLLIASLEDLDFEDPPKSFAPDTESEYFVPFSDPERDNYYFVEWIDSWEILIIATANSGCIEVLGIDEGCWSHFQLDDTATPQLPLNANDEDTYPLGLVVDYNSKKIKLIFLSNEGSLCFYEITNDLNSEIARPIPDTEFHKYKKTKKEKPKQLEEPQIKENVKTNETKKEDQPAPNFISTKIPNNPLSNIGSLGAVGKSPISSIPLSTPKFVTPSTIFSVPPITTEKQSFGLNKPFDINPSPVNRPGTPIENPKNINIPPQNSVKNPPVVKQEEKKEENPFYEHIRTFKKSLEEIETLKTNSSNQISQMKNGTHPNFKKSDLSTIDQKLKGLQDRYKNINKNYETDQKRVDMLKLKYIKAIGLETEAKSQLSMKKDRQYQILMQNRALDPESEKIRTEINEKMAEVKSRINELETHLSQVWQQKKNKNKNQK